MGVQRFLVPIFGDKYFLSWKFRKSGEGNGKNQAGFYRGFFKSKQIGQYLPVASVFAHLSHIILLQVWQIWSPVVIVPQSSHGALITSMVMLTFALCSESTPIAFARAARLVSLRSIHSIIWSSIAMML